MREEESFVMVVGGGAAGLIAAITMARRGVKVTLLEQSSKIGRKILVSGNGQCNITNRHIAPNRFHSQNPDFAEGVLSGYGFDVVESFFASIGLELVEGKEGKMFPMSMQAGSVVELLEYEARSLGVNIECGCEVKGIQKKNDTFMLETSQGIKSCEKLLLATGSPAAPQLGGNRSGLEFAKSLGHTLIPLHPSLVQLCSDERWVKRASGVKTKGIVKLYVNGEHITQKEGDLLFTNYGISGLAILDISREASLRLAEYAYCELRLDLLPDFGKEKLAAFLIGRIRKESIKPLGLWLQGILNKKLIPVVLEQSKCKAQIESELNRKEVGKLVYALKNLKLSVSETRGFKGAEIAAGGVDTAEVDPATMESRYVRNLYLAGELLDVDGDRGGFNFHFAWVSGMRAAKAIVDED